MFKVLQGAAAPLSHRGAPMASSLQGGVSHSLVQKRGYVVPAVADALRKTAIGNAAIQGFRIQAMGECIPNSRDMWKQLASTLTAQGRLERVAPTDRLTGIFSWHVGVDDYVELNEKHGPLNLTLQGIVPVGQGREWYTHHHCMILLATLPRPGRSPMGLFVDGNDLQSNDVASSLLFSLQSRGQPGSLADRSMDDLKSHAAFVDPPVDPACLVFRLIDLSNLVTMSNAAFESRTRAYPGMVDYDPNLRVKESVLSPQEREQLERALQDSWQPIEHLLPDE